jgi:hypothetical protein
MASDETTKRLCPHCGSDRVQWSRSGGVERLVRFTGIGFFRCRQCKHRFSGFRGWSHHQTRVALYLVGIVATFLIVWLALKYFDLRLSGGD